MTDHPKEADPKGVNPSGQGPAQPRDVDEKNARQSTKQPGADTTSPESQAEADEDTYD